MEFISRKHGRESEVGVLYISSSGQEQLQNSKFLRAMRRVIKKSLDSNTEISYKVKKF